MPASSTLTVRLLKLQLSSYFVLQSLVNGGGGADDSVVDPSEDIPMSE
jgi:hypothetical protein